MTRGLSLCLVAILAAVCFQSVAANAANVTYTYDNAGRLVGADYDGTSITWTYDANGNLLNRTVGPRAGNYALATTIHIPLSQTAAQGLWVAVWAATPAAFIANEILEGSIDSVSVTLSNVQFDWYWIGVYDYGQGSYVTIQWKGVFQGLDTEPLAGTPTASVATNAFGGSAISQSMSFSQFSPSVVDSWYWCGVYQFSSFDWLGISDWVYPSENRIDTGQWQPVTTDGDWYWIGILDYAGLAWINGVYTCTVGY